MPQPARPSGIIVATVTPYDAAGRVDLGAARDHAAFLVEQGVGGLAPVGTTGEFLFLSEQEKRDLVAAAVAGAAGRAPVVAGIWALSPVEVGELARAAAGAGADAVFLTTPIYYRYPATALAAWYRSAAAATRLPLYAYNIPAYSGNEIPVSLFAELAGDGTVAGIKDSAADSERLAAELAAARGKAAVYAASDAFALEARRLGADGFISALANAFPRTFLAIWNGDRGAPAARGGAHKVGHGTRAQQTAERLRAAVKGHGGIAAVKHLVAARGFPGGGTRLPFSGLDDAGRAVLDELVQELEGAA